MLRLRLHELKELRQMGKYAKITPNHIYMQQPPTA